MFFGRRRPRHYGGGENNIFVVMMFAQLLSQIDRLPYKPPVTLGLMGLMSVLYFQPELFQLSSSVIHSHSFNPSWIVDYGEYHRIFFSVLLHLSSTHLYYNLSSFLYKGVALESLLGSEKFLLVILLLTCFTQGTFLVLSFVAEYIFHFYGAWTTYTVGFSGILFALKVLINSVGEENPFSFSHMFGLNLPWNKVVWMELILAHFMVPGSSFLGHLSGIVGGILFLPFFFSIHSGRRITVFSQEFWNNLSFFNTDQNNQNPYRSHSGRQAPPPPPQSTRPISPEELRQRRMNRFS